MTDVKVAEAMRQDPQITEIEPLDVRG